MQQDPINDALNNNPLGRVPVELTISVGSAKPSVRELLDLKPNDVLQLDRKISDPVEIFVGGRLIARGELQEFESEIPGQLAVKLTDVLDIDEGT